MVIAFLQESRPEGGEAAVLEVDRRASTSTTRVETEIRTAARLPPSAQPNHGGQARAGQDLDKKIQLEPGPFSLSMRQLRLPTV